MFRPRRNPPPSGGGGSQVVAPDGSGLCNPGVRTRWLGPTLPAGVPVVVADDPVRYGDLVGLALDDPAA